jgi:ribosomal protein S27E
VKRGLSRRVGAVIAFVTMAALTVLGSVVGQADTAHAVGDPVATLSVPSTIVEGTGGTTALLASITLDVPAATNVSLTFATTDGTASSVGSEDFQPQSITVTLLAGAVGPVNLNIPITTDDIDEADETLSMSLTPISAGITVTGSPAMTTILDDDAPVVATLSVPSTVVEGTGGTTNLTAQISLSRTSAENLVMTFATADGSASSVGTADFQAQSITVTILAGALGPVNLNIPITPDAVIESNETFSSSVTPISPGIVVAGSPATTTILDDDAPLVATLSVPSTVVEGTGGTTNLTAQITLNHPSATTLNMTFATTDGSASSVADADFQAQSITVTFLAGAAANRRATAISANARARRTGTSMAGVYYPRDAAGEVQLERA